MSGNEVTAFYSKYNTKPKRYIHESRIFTHETNTFFLNCQLIKIHKQQHKHRLNRNMKTSHVTTKENRTAGKITNSQNKINHSRSHKHTQRFRTLWRYCYILYKTTKIIKIKNLTSSTCFLFSSLFFNWKGKKKHRLNTYNNIFILQPTDVK